MTRYALRHPAAGLRTVRFDRRAAELMPEALSHVGKQVFEANEDGRHHLYDAARAVRAALADDAGGTVAVGLTEDEGSHVPEALRHVAREVFRGRVEGRLLASAAETVAEAFPAGPAPGR